MRKIIYTILSCLIFHGASAQCNGYPELCGKRFNEVAYAMTHNAYNAENEGFSLGNQTFGLSKQMQDGVRGLMLDIHESGGQVVVYHGFSFLGSQPLSDNLAEIKAFLDGNPNEILSIIFETNVSSTALEDELTAAGLMSYLHHQDLGEPWPTLQEMIDAGTRLVVFSEADNGLAGQTWYHYAWAHTFDTPYSFSNPSEFSCEVNRGSIDNDLYLINHWITTGLGTGDSIQAAIVNANPLLGDRVSQCQSETERFPNFIGVDFHHLGDVMDVVNNLNGVQSTPTSTLAEAYETHAFPNPAQGHIWVTSTHPDACEVAIRDILGRQVAVEEVKNGEVRINTENWGKGFYFYQLSGMDGAVLAAGQIVIN